MVAKKAAPILISGMLWAVLIGAMWLTRPEADRKAFASDDAAVVSAAIAEYEDYPFIGVVGAQVYAASMRTWWKDVFDPDETRIAPTNRRELPRLLRKASDGADDKVVNTVLMSGAGFVLGWVWVFVGGALFRAKAAQRGPYAYRGTNATMALVLAGFGAALIAPFAVTESPWTAILVVPTVVGWILYWRLAKTTRQARPSS